MGRIFSYQEIERQQIPEAIDFEHARDVFLEEVSSSSDINGGFVYGSVAIGSANRRSDFDVFLSLGIDAPKCYDAAKYIVESTRLATGYKIPKIVPIIQPRSALESGHHDMDRFFGMHLSSKYRVVVGDDPAEYTVFSKAPAKDILANYLFQKKRRLSNAYTSSEPLDVEEGGIQRMLELPLAVGRKAMQALSEVGVIDEAVEQSADKRAVLTASRSLFEEYDLASGFSVLVSNNTEYEDLLDAAIAGEVNKATYEGMLKSFHKRLPGAVIWIERIANTLLPILASLEE